MLDETDKESLVETMRLAKVSASKPFWPSWLRCAAVIWAKVTPGFLRAARSAFSRSLCSSIVGGGLQTSHMQDALCFVGDISGTGGGGNGAEAVMA